jgi:ABC-type histidine transport system ATPase subunit
VTTLQERELLAIRGSKVAMVFQDPMSALDPVFTIGQQIKEVVVVHEGVSRAAARARALELLEPVQIPSARRRLDAFPHELSGGLRQRGGNPAVVDRPVARNPAPGRANSTPLRVQWPPSRRPRLPAAPHREQSCASKREGSSNSLS